MRLAHTQSANQPPPTQPSDSPTHTTQLAKIRKSTWQHVPRPPAKIAIPTFGSDAAASHIRFALRAAVLQVPDVTLKMSTALERPLIAAQGMRLAHTQSANQPPPTQPSDSPTHTTQLAKIRKSTWQHVPPPPAKIATPTFGSDVAARSVRATLRAAVLQAPDVTLKMSTTLE
jgi:hypothetical protein